MINVEFYSLSMIFFLLKNDLLGGKYLWKRAPIQLKNETSEFFHLYSICKALLQEQILIAYEIIHTIKWSSVISRFIIEFHSILQHRALELVQSSYKEINLIDLTQLLNVSEQYCIECNLLPSSSFLFIFHLLYSSIYFVISFSLLFSLYNKWMEYY